MKWIELETVLEIHNRIINYTGGSYGLRDKNALESALFLPLATFDGRELYPGIVEKVAVLLFKIANNHPFMESRNHALQPLRIAVGVLFQATAFLVFLKPPGTQ